MTRNEFTQSRKVTLEVITDIVKREGTYHPPTYKSVIAELHRKGIKTAWGNDWTMPRLCMFLHRMGYVGLHGVFQSQRS